MTVETPGQPVLVVEVDSAKLRDFRRALRDQGYDPVSASSVKEAVATLAQRHFVFIILDGNLDRTDGHGLLRQFRANAGEPATPVAASPRALRGDTRAVVGDDPVQARVPFRPEPADAGRGDRMATGPMGVRSLKDVARIAARAAERELIGRALEQTGWNRVRAAKLLNISYRALLYKITDAGLEPGGPPER